tara:strand:- start:619 stop:1134 length:516 start_codon:yes stop_codon:yes gene_type:complete
MTKLPQLYCDMDGVLCDFKSQAQKATGMSMPQWIKEPGKKFKTIRDKWKPIKDYPRFWETMPWQPGGKQLWNYISKFNPDILSAYVEKVTDPNCIPGKTKWARTNLGSRPKLNLVKRIQKQDYAQTGYKSPAVLIDDYEKNIRQFEARGGIGILHTSTPKTIAKLKSLGYK